jgi:TolB protein
MRAIAFVGAIIGLVLVASYGENAQAITPGTNGKIAFDSNRDGNHEIYVMNADGSAQTRLTDNPAFDEQPAWSPDGTRIAFNSDRNGNHDIFVMNADGTNVQRLTTSSADEASASWSPDGQSIAYDVGVGENHSDIWVMSSNGSNKRNLTANVDSFDTFPAWSPEGRFIAFGGDRDGPFDIYVMNADGSGVRNVSSSSAWQDFRPDWSPDGSTIVFNGYGINGNTEYLEVFLISPAGTGLKQITFGTDFDTGPSWSPDGTTIATAVSTTREGNYDVGLINPNGTGYEDLLTIGTGTSMELNPDWQPRPPVMCTVASVMDGDSFTCADGKTIDMLQIDAPELGQCGGGWAKAALENIFLTPGRVVRLDFDRTRTAGVATLASPVARGTDGVDYNISIIMAYVGLAKSATVGASNTRFLDWANASQAWAQAAQWNMWAPGKTYTGGCD